MSDGSFDTLQNRCLLGGLVERLSPEDEISKKEFHFNLNFTLTEEGVLIFW